MHNPLHGYSKVLGHRLFLDVFSLIDCSAEVLFYHNEPLCKGRGAFNPVWSLTFDTAILKQRKQVHL
jgi:hypothetical protein